MSFLVPVGLGIAAGYGASQLMKAPKIPEIPTIAPPTVTQTIPKEEELKEEEKKKLKKGREKRSTILTSPLGILEPADVGLKSLLGE